MLKNETLICWLIHCGLWFWIHCFCCFIFSWSYKLFDTLMRIFQDFSISCVYFRIISNDTTKCYKFCTLLKYKLLFDLNTNCSSYFEMKFERDVNLLFIIEKYMSKCLLGCIEIKCEWVGQDLNWNATAKEINFFI